MYCKDGPWKGYSLVVASPTLWFTVGDKTFRYNAGFVEYRK